MRRVNSNANMDTSFDEIKRLDSIGFIRPTPTYRDGHGFNAIREENERNESEFDLKKYVELTDEGKAYLAIRYTVETPEQRAAHSHV
jgi:hypothetical protein